MAVRIAGSLEPSAIVYDCMDELSAFLGAPPELLERERELLDRAGAVFTGGPSLYEAKRKRHPAVHCFPSSVDVEHFARARDASDPADQSRLPRPRLGYYGVIDERIDVAILDRMAEAHPDWSVVMVGPVVKIDPGILPRRPNLHLLGQKPYAELPAYAGGWDVCMMPFAINRATRYISPTKVLEYMAAERPIVSTPIHDVAVPYGEIVYVGQGPDGFLAACERALSASEVERRLRREGARRVVERTSWDETVERMDRILESLAAGAAIQSPGTAHAEGARS
jgi:UDP-galactopyranose mutase